MFDPRLAAHEPPRLARACSQEEVGFDYTTDPSPDRGLVDMACF